MSLSKPGLVTRTAAAALWLTSMAAGAPQLTTIQDVLFKADGTKFNGVAVVGWKSFVSADSSNITMQSVTVRIVDGNLRVQLVPNATSDPLVYYQVKYNSDGKVQFEEAWVVPASATPLRVRDVRVKASAAPIEAGVLPIQQTDVIGLVSDLSARPVKGPGYAPGRAAMVGTGGGIEAVSGNPSDCVRVDGTSGPCGAAEVVNLHFIDGETPAGPVDGANASFTLSAMPDPVNSLLLYRNGMLQKRDQDFTLTGTQVEFVAGAVPQPGDTLLASFRLSLMQAAGLPQVLCSGAGTGTSATEFTSLGACTVAAGLLTAGDRVEVLFDYAHEGTATEFSFRVQWGGTTALERACGAADTMVTGRGEATLGSDGAQISVQSWGSALPLAAGLLKATDAYAPGITIDFAGKMAAEGSEAVALRHYSVVRYPGPGEP